MIKKICFVLLFGILFSFPASGNIDSKSGSTRKTLITKIQKTSGNLKQDLIGQLIYLDQLNRNKINSRTKLNAFDLKNRLLLHQLLDGDITLFNNRVKNGIHLVNIYFNQNKIDKAILVLEELYRFSQQKHISLNPVVLQYLSKLYSKQHNYKKAEFYFAKYTMGSRNSMSYDQAAQNFGVLLLYAQKAKSNNQNIYLDAWLNLANTLESDSEKIRILKKWVQVSIAAKDEKTYTRVKDLADIYKKQHRWAELEKLYLHYVDSVDHVEKANKVLWDYYIASKKNNSVLNLDILIRLFNHHKTQKNFKEEQQVLSDIVKHKDFTVDFSSLKRLAGLSIINEDWNNAFKYHNDLYQDKYVRLSRQGRVILENLIRISQRLSKDKSYTKYLEEKIFSKSKYFIHLDRFTAYKELGSHYMIRQAYTEGTALFEKVKNSTLISKKRFRYQIQIQGAEFAEKRGDYKAAFEIYEDALKSTAKTNLKNRNKKLAIVQKMIVIAKTKLQYQSLLVAYKALQGIYQEQNNKEVIHALWEIASLYEKNHELQNSIGTYKEALETSKHFKDAQWESKILSKLNQLDTGTAKQKLSRLLELESSQKRSNSKSDLAMTRLEIGNLYLQSGKASKATKYYLLSADHQLLKQARQQTLQLITATDNLHNLSKFKLSNSLADKLLSTGRKLQQKDFQQLWSCKASNYLNQKRLSQASVSIEKAIDFRTGSDKTALKILQAEIQYRYKKYDRVIQILNPLRTDEEKLSTEIYFYQGRAYFKKAEYPKAVKYLKKSKEIVEQHEVKNFDSIQVYNLLSQCYFRLGQLKMAIKEQTKLIDNLNQKNDTDRLGIAHVNLAKFYIQAGHLNEAKEANFKAGQMIQKGTAKWNDYLYTQAQISQKLKKYSEALEMYKRIMHGFNSESNYFFTGSVFYNQGLLLIELAKFKKAEKALTKSVAYFSKINDSKSILLSKLALANVKIKRGDYKNAEKLLITLQTNPGNTKHQEEILIILSKLKAETGFFSEALQMCDQAIFSFKKQQDKVRMVEAMVSKALLYQKINDVTSAEITYNNALKINEELKNDLMTAVIISNLGVLYQKTNKLDQALNAFFRASKIQSDMGFKSELALTVNNIAATFMSKKDYKKAIEYLGESRQIAIKFNLERDIALSYSNEGIAYFHLNKFEKAKSSFKKAFKIQQKLENKTNQAKTLNNLAFVEKKTGNLKKAVDTLQKAINILSFKQPKRGSFYPNPDINQIIAPNIAKNLLLNKGVWLRKLAVKSTHQKINILKAAADSLSKSIELIEIIRQQMKAEESQEILVAQNIEIFEQLITILFELGTQTKNSKYFAQAFPVSEQSKARSFLDKFQEQVAISNIRLSKKFRNRENLLKSEMISVVKQLFEELNKPEKEKDLKKIKYLKMRKNELSIAFKSMKTELEDRYPNYANIKYPSIYDVELIRKKILDKSSVIIAYFTGIEASYGWYISMDRFQMMQLPERKQLKKLVQRYRVTLKNPLSYYDDDEETDIDNRNLHLSIGNQLYHLLIDPFKIEKDKKSILFLSDGSLHYLPFETLISDIDIAEDDEQIASPTYLLEKYSIFYSPSASVLGAVKGKRLINKKKYSKNKLFLGFGDPEFSLDEVEATFKPNLIFQKKGFYDLARLLGTSDEINKISALYPKANRLYFLQKSATEEKVKELSKDYKLIHFATHGILDEENPEYSGVVMNLIRSKKDDGFLNSSEIWNMKLNADLVTLSACETGLGRIVKGEGLVGLTRSFLYAGASSVIVSLWTVSDESTSELMIYFYELLKKGTPKIEALRQAKIKLMGNKNSDSSYQDPFYWGPFILNGAQH